MLTGDKKMNSPMLRAYLKTGRLAKGKPVLLYYHVHDNFFGGGMALIVFWGNMFARGLLRNIL